MSQQGSDNHGSNKQGRDNQGRSIQDSTVRESTDDDLSRAPFRQVKRQIMEWGTGTTARPGPSDSSTHSSTPAGPAATIALADRGHLPAVIASGLVGPTTVVLTPPGSDQIGSERDDGFIPVDTGPPGSSGILVEYYGSLAEPGADFSVGDDFFLQTQDYAGSAFMSVLGPTLIRITDSDDFTAFLADADRALAEGLFPDFAIAPSVFLADLPGLGADTGADGPGLRLFIDEQGTISTSPNGAALGTVGAGPEELAAAWRRINDATALPCGVCLGAAVPEPERNAALLARPFIGRYLRAIEALRMLTANEITGVQVSGFGGRLTPGLPQRDDANDLLDPALPVVLWTADQAYVYQPGGRVFGVDRASAEAVESLLVAGPAAAEYVPAATIAQVERFFAEQGVALAGADAPVAVGAR